MRNWYDDLMESDKLIYGHECKENDPAGIFFAWEQMPYSDPHTPLDWEGLRDKMGYGIGGDTVIQRFIYSPTGKAQMVRVHYKNPKYSSSQVNVAYAISNKMNYWDFNYPIKNRCTHMKGSKNSFTVYEMRGNLRIYETQIASLCTYLSRSWGYKFEELVCDFVTDEFGNAFFVNCKSFKLYNATMLNELAFMDDDTREYHKTENKAVIARANNSVSCTLCRLNFSKSEVTKIVTMKMLFKLKQHLNKRGIFKFEYLEMFKGQ